MEGSKVEPFYHTVLSYFKKLANFFEGQGISYLDQVLEETYLMARESRIKKPGRVVGRFGPKIWRRRDCGVGSSDWGVTGRACWLEVRGGREGVNTQLW